MAEKISEHMVVRITLGSLVALLAAVICFVTWMTVMQSTADAHTKDIGSVQEKLESIDHRMSHLEGLLEYLIKTTKEK